MIARAAVRPAAARVRTVADRRRSLAERLHGEANRIRASHGRPALIWDPDLAAAALDHAHDLLATQRFSHTGSDGSNVLQRVHRRSAAWAGAGENLAIGQQTAVQAVAGWLASPGHRANLLRPGFTHAGTATLTPPPSSPYANGLLWVQVYGSTLWCEARSAPTVRLQGPDRHVSSLSRAFGEIVRTFLERSAPERYESDRDRPPPI
jgi:uncharacterized protein YkwD